MLVFLPGIGEIRRVEQFLADRVSPDVDIRLLAGALSFAEQDLALMPSPDGRRRVVLSTDIAESSFTVSGVRIVVDAGLARVPAPRPRQRNDSSHDGQHEPCFGRSAVGARRAHRARCRLSVVEQDRACDAPCPPRGRDHPGRSGRCRPGAGHMGYSDRRSAVHRPATGTGHATGARPVAASRRAGCRRPSDGDRPSDAGAPATSPPRTHGRRRAGRRHEPGVRDRGDPRRARRVAWPCR